MGKCNKGYYTGCSSWLESKRKKEGLAQNLNAAKCTSHEDLDKGETMEDSNSESTDSSVKRETPSHGA